MQNTLNDRDSMRPAAAGAVRPRLDWKKALWAGIIAGLVFVMMEMMLVAMVQGMSPWAPPAMMAAMVLGPGILQQPPAFSMKIMMIAMMVHLPLSMMYGLVLGWIVHRLERRAALMAGAAFGLIAAYLVNFYLIAPMVFPWFTEARNWISVVSHVMFGVVLAGAYVAMRRR